MTACASSEVTDPNTDGKQRSKWMRKTRMCSYQRHGTCTFGEDCFFAHSADELQERPDLTKTQLCPDFENGSCTNANCNYAHSVEELKPFPTLKQKICMWYRKGTCNNGDACCFAHGRKDLRSSETTSSEPSANAAANHAKLLAAAARHRGNEAPLKQPIAREPEGRTKWSFELAAHISAPQQATFQELLPQMHVQAEASQVNDMVTQSSLPPGSKVTFQCGKISAPRKHDAQSLDLIYAWRRTPLSSKGVPFVPSNGSNYGYFDSSSDGTSTYAETAGYISD